MLLLSNGVQRTGIGNAYDLVGRYFLEHPHVAFAGAFVLDADPWRSDRKARRALEVFFSGEGKKNAVLCPSPEAQREHGLLNAAFGSTSTSAAGAASSGASGARCARRSRLEDATTRRRQRGQRTTRRRAARACTCDRRWCPTRTTAIKLVDEVDELGSAPVHLTWNLGTTDLDGVQRMLALLARELALRHGLGRGRIGLDPDNPWRYCSGGSHHLGTTRMSTSPTQGVVDTDCRVHGVGNLYVAGSSVYPTGGHANPTLTLVALAMRLAGHLERNRQRRDRNRVRNRRTAVPTRQTRRRSAMCAGRRAAALALDDLVMDAGVERAELFATAARPFDDHACRPSPRGRDRRSPAARTATDSSTRSAPAATPSRRRDVTITFAPMASRFARVPRSRKRRPRWPLGRSLR